MASDNSKELNMLLNEVKAVILHTQKKTKELEISEIELEINTVAEYGVHGEINLYPLKVSGHYEEGQTQTLNIKMIPKPTQIELMGMVSEELILAIDSIKKAIEYTTTSEPTFELKEAMVKINFAVDKNGKLLFFLGGSKGTKTDHTAKLILKPSKSKN